MIINFFVIIIVIIMSDTTECRDKPNVIKQTLIPREKPGQKPTTPKKTEPTNVPRPIPTKDEKEDEIGQAIE